MFTEVFFIMTSKIRLKRKKKNNICTKSHDCKLSQSEVMGPGILVPFRQPLYTYNFKLINKMPELQ